MCDGTDEGVGQEKAEEGCEVHKKGSVSAFHRRLGPPRICYTVLTAHPEASFRHFPHTIPVKPSNMASSSPPLSTSLSSEKEKDGPEVVHANTQDAEPVPSKLHNKHDVIREDTDIDFSHVDEAATLRKMDSRLIPVLAILYLLSFLDRG